MSSAIANVIIGVPLTKEIHTAINEIDGDHERHAEEWFEELYSAHCGDESPPPPPGFCGTKISEFTVGYKVRSDAESEAEAMCSDLPEEVKAVALPFGVWSSS